MKRRTGLETRRWYPTQVLFLDPYRSRPVAKDSALTRSEVNDIYTTYGALMRRRCRIVLRDDALGDDAMQDAFINLIRYGAAFRDVTAKLRWLYTLCDRCCFAVIDRRKKGRVREEKFEMPVSTPDADRHVHRARVMAVLDGLDEKARRVAILAFLDGLSQGEIGETLGWSRQTINKKLKEIKAHAKLVLEDEE